MPYMVFYDDENGLYVPMGLNEERAGAIDSYAAEPLIFPDRPSAARAVRISKNFALLHQSQGLPFDYNFTVGARHIKIVKCKWFSKPVEKGSTS